MQERPACQPTGRPCVAGDERHRHVRGHRAATSLFAGSHKMSTVTYSNLTLSHCKQIPVWRAEKDHTANGTMARRMSRNTTPISTDSIDSIPFRQHADSRIRENLQPSDAASVTQPWNATPHLEVSARPPAAYPVPRIPFQSAISSTITSSAKSYPHA